jgi:GNAT superfamily N-acetyltransferase
VAALEAVAVVQDAVYPDDPVELDLLLSVLDRVPWSFDVAALRAGAPVAWGSCRPRVANPASSTAFARLVVLPAERRCGIGGAVLHELARVSGERGKTDLMFTVMEGDRDSQGFLERRGYAVVARDQESELLIAESDVTAVDAPPGIRIANLGDEPELRRGMYAVALHAIADAPAAEESPPPDYEHWCAMELDRPDMPPDGQLAAVAGDGQVLGYLLLSVSSAQHDTVWHAMTATAREARGRGVASALKRAAVLWARERGFRRLRTENEERNAPMLAINRRMGYRPTPAWLSMRGPIGE